MTYKDYHWSRAWELFKENLRPANQVFYTFFAIEGVLPSMAYNLMIQIPHLNFFQILVLLLIWFSSWLRPSSLCRFIWNCKFILTSLMPTVSSSVWSECCWTFVRFSSSSLEQCYLASWATIYASPSLFRLDRCMAFLCQWYLWPCLSKTSTKNWYPNDEKNLVKYALKFYAYVMVIWPLWAWLSRGSLEKPASWSRPDRPTGLDRSGDGSWDLLSTGHTRKVRSLVENPAKLEGVYRYFILSPSEYETWRLNAQFPSYIQLSLHLRILTASIWAIKTSRASMSPCLITRRYLLLPGNHRRQASLGGPLQGSCDSHSGSFDGSDYGCWSWDRLYDAEPRNFDGSDW